MGGQASSSKMHMCVGCLVKWNSLWPYTTLQSYNFIEGIISKIVTGPMNKFSHADMPIGMSSCLLLWDLLSDLKMVQHV